MRLRRFAPSAGFSFRFDLEALLGAGFLAVILAAYVFPIGRELRAGIAGLAERGFSESTAALFAELVPVLLVTLAQAMASASASLAFALPLGFLLSRPPVFARNAWIHALAPRAALLGLLRGTFFLPTLSAIHLTLFLLAGSPHRYGFFAVVVAHFLLNAGWLAVESADAFAGLPSTEIAVARTLGANPWRRLRDFVLPELALRLRDPFLIAFGLCFGSFTIVLLLGGGPPVQTLETEMYSSLRLGAASSERRLAIFLLQAIVGLGLALLSRRKSRVRSGTPPGPTLFARGAFEGAAVHPSNSSLRASLRRPPRPSPRPSPGAMRTGRLRSALPSVLLLVFIGALLITLGSLEGTSSLIAEDSFRASVALSARIGAGTSALVTLVCFAVVGSGRFAGSAARVAAFLGGLSPFLVAGAFLRAFPALDRADAGAESLGLVLLSTLVQLPFQYRFLHAWRVSEDFSAYEMARSLGASRLRAGIDLLWPRWKWIAVALVASAFFFGFTESAVSFLYGGADAVPFSLWLSRAESRYAFGLARAAQGFLFALWILLVIVQTAVARAGSPSKGMNA